jgi:capsule polysaccharide export protein KpsE/RkpR
MKSNLDSSHLILFVYNRLRIFIIVGIAATLISSAVSLMMEEKFESSVIMFATTQSSIGQQFYEEMNSGDILSYGETEDAERLLQLLNSSLVRGKIIKSHKLAEHYDIEVDEPGGKTLLQKEYNSNVSASLTRYGSIRVAVMNKDPQLAKEIANHLVQLTDSLANKLRNERAKLAFKLAKQAYEKALNEIQAAEDNLGKLHEQGIYNFEAQVEGLTIQYGTAIANNNMKGARIIQGDLYRISKLANEYNELANFLEPAYEQLATLKKRVDQLKVDAETMLPSSLVVDLAEVADKKSYPVRWMIVVVSVLSTLAMTLIVLLVLDSIKSAES